MSMKDIARQIAGNLWREKTLHYEYPAEYKEAAQKPVIKNRIVFLEVREDHLTDSFDQIYTWLEAQGTYDLQTVCIGEGMKGRHAVRTNCLNAIPVIAQAKYVFVNDSCYFLSSLPLRPETKVIQLWHACGAFKKFGYSVADKLFGASRRGLERFPVHKNFTYVTVSSPEVAWAYAEAFHMEDRKDAFLPTGISRTDVFYDEQKIAEAKEELDFVCTFRDGRKVLLYAPTFRGKVATASSPDKLDIRKMKEKLGDRYILLCKHHPFVKMRPQIPEDCRDFAMDVTEYMDIEKLLMVSDMCISDYSSLVFEYSIFERPMIFFAYDLENYGDWRGFYYPYEEMTPGPVVKTSDEVIETILEQEKNFDKARVHAFREKFMASCDGHATERIMSILASDM